MNHSQSGKKSMSTCQSNSMPAVRTALRSDARAWANSSLINFSLSPTHDETISDDDTQ